MQFLVKILRSVLVTEAKPLRDHQFFICFQDSELKDTEIDKGLLYTVQFIKRASKSPDRD